MATQHQIACDGCKADLTGKPHVNIFVDIKNKRNQVDFCAECYENEASGLAVRFPFEPDAK